MYTDYKTAYKDETARYTKKDAVHALYFTLYVFLLFVVFWVLAAVLDVGRIARELPGVLLVLLVFLPLFFIVRGKGQGLRSLGLKKPKITLPNFFILWYSIIR